MAFCRTRSGYKRRSTTKKGEESIIRTLTYHDSDGEGSGHDGNSSTGGSSPIWSPEREVTDIRMDDHSSEFLELDLPTTNAFISSPLSSRRSRFSPIPFSLEEVDEEQVSRNEHELCRNSSGGMSPPHRKLRALRLFDTPHTPKSLLEKARRRRPTGEKGKLCIDRPQTNVNPFTPGPRDQNDSGISGCGKRSRSELER